MTAPSNETNEEPSLTSWKTYAVGIQMLFVAFGALVLIPILVGMHPSIALFTAGAGTLLFTFITRGQIPVFLASSFAFLAPMSISLEKYGYGATFCGMFSVGIVYAILAIAIAYFGPGFIKRILPPIVTGPVIMVIGLGLAPTAASMAVSSAGSSDFSGIALIVSFSTAGTAIAMALNKNRTLNLLPILIAIIVGYLVSIPFGLVDFKPVIEAAPIQWPWTSASAAGTFEWMEFSLPAILLFIPVSIVPAVEHFGDILAVQSVTKKDYLKEPGLHRTILGDGVATALAAALGGPPNTTYSEVTGAIALTGAYSTRFMRIAAVTSIVLSFVGILGAFLQTIPTPVMGGILILVFGMIGSIGLKTMIAGKVDFEEPKNYIIFAVIMMIGVGQLTIELGDFIISGVGLAAILGILLNAVLPSKVSQSAA
ncbi:MAG: NCS2 family nucleobase:cation symporter [Opitutales bacterium]|nr:NCS2 family nucleobase:cation symporter [Opitutales bacterium]NRA28095.1 uracil permease [Opitutales bacterium]